MIGRQTMFYTHPDDYAELAAGLTALGATVIGGRSPTSEPVTADIAVPQARASVTYMLTRPEYLAALRPEHSANQQAWFFDEQNDPLVELDIWRPREGILRPGRVYFTTGRWNMTRLARISGTSRRRAFAERLRR